MNCKKYYIYLLLALVASRAVADEGMWTMFNLPDAVYSQMRSYGWQQPRSVLYGGDDAISRKVVNFSGYCTGEVVSPMGLVMTNHHCGFEAVRSHSSVEHDYMLNGFVADSLGAELPNDNMFVAFLVTQRDITSDVKAAGYDTLDKDGREAILDSIEHALSEDARKADSTYYVEVNPFYEGNAFYATTYQRYNDIRLVFAPPKSMGKFGGETDNWVWPRQTCDFSVFRIYVDPVTGAPAEYNERNVPYGTDSLSASRGGARHLQVSTEGYKPGDFSMVVGYPGSTRRYLSSYGIREMRDCFNDPMQQVRGVKQDIMRRHMDASEAVRIKYDSKYAQSANYWKNAIGMNKCIDSVGLVNQKREYEQRLMAWVDSVKQAGTDTLFISQVKNLDLGLLDSLYDFRHNLRRAQVLYLETFNGRRSNNELMSRVMAYNHGSIPHTMKHGKVMKRYCTFADNADSWERDLDIEAMAAMMKNYREQMLKMDWDTAEFDVQYYIPSVYKTIDEDYGGDYRKYLEYVWDNTILMQPGARIPVKANRKLRRDPGIQLAEAIDKAEYELRSDATLHDFDMAEQERMLCAAKIRMEEDMPHYSDANFTMRLSYGQVGGYKLGDYDSGYFTTAQSLIDKVNLYERDSALAVNPYVEYYAEPIFKSLLADFEHPLCFLTNNDITGGNSGSPVIDGKGRLTGLAFDGTWDSLSSDIYFDTTLARMIAVDIRYVIYIMKHWGHADRLLQEMGVELR